MKSDKFEINKDMFPKKYKKIIEGIENSVNGHLRCAYLQGKKDALMTIRNMIDREERWWR